MSNAKEPEITGEIIEQEIIEQERIEQETNGELREIKRADRIPDTASLVALLKRNAALYTGGDTSLPARTLERLSSSIMFTLRGKHDPLLNDEELEGEFLRGQRIVKSKIAYAKGICRDVCANLPPVTNIAMRDTIDSLKGFEKVYDYRFFAHEMPCSIDYPLSAPIDDSVKGIDYICRYLEHLRAENRFISKFSKESLEALYAICCPEYDDLAVNLFEPCAANAVAMVMAGGELARLALTRTRLKRLEASIESMTPADVKAALLKAADTVCRQLNITSEFERDYFTSSVISLLPRILAARDEGLGGVFSAKP